MKKIFTVLFSILFCFNIVAQTAETEPNNSFTTANLIRVDSTRTGGSNNITDPSDYFKTGLPKDGTLKIYVSATNTGGSTGYLYMYGYDGRKGGGQVMSKYVANTGSVLAGKTVFDTIYLYGRAVDSFFFRLDASGTFSYNLRYTIVDTSTNDVEPNGIITQSITIDHLVEKQGHIRYTEKGTPDNYDYYRTLLPKDGTLKIYVKGTNMSGGTCYLYMYGFDGRGNPGQILGKYIANSGSIPAGVTIYDTIYLFGRAVDTFFFRMEGSGAFKYSVKYDIVDTSMNDAEPNGIIYQARPINHLEEKQGHVRYTEKGVPDNYDYYRTLLPKDGTLKIYVKGTNMSGTTSYLYMYGFDGRGNPGQILGKYIANSGSIPAGVTIYDTIYLFGRAVDSFFFRMEGSGAFKYSLKYDIVDTSMNDAEPNGIIYQARPINPLEEKQGHVRYTEKGVPDYYDYYRTLLPKDGTLKIYVKGTNMSGGTSYLYMYGFDGRGNPGQILGKYIANSGSIPAGVTIYDTIYLFGRAVDSIFFRMEGSGAFKYSLKYEMVDTGTNDQEPNGSFAESVLLPTGQIKSGHIHYVAKGTPDNYDYYRTVLPSDGTVKLYVNGKNRNGSTGYLYVYGYDGRKGTGQILGKYITNSGSIPAGVTIYDTILLFCRAKDTLYYRVEASVAFSYNISYEMVNQSVNDIEPNNGFNTSIVTPIGQKREGHIGYFVAGAEDNDDYYKTILPPKGSLRLFTEVTNTGSGNGYVYIYVYDKRKGSGQLLGKYIKNTGSLAAGGTFRDTILLNCVSSDTVYLRWTSSGCFKYSYTAEFVDRKPVANTENERIGSTVGFRPQFTNANSFVWDFGDGTKSTLKYPIKTYGVGYYVAKLIVTNSVCNFKDTASEIIEVKGVEFYTPKLGGSGGDVNMQIFGGGLDTSTIIKLVKGTEIIFPVEKYTNSIHNQLTAILDLHFVEPGTYDVVIEIPGQPAITYPNGFVVNKLLYPYTWSEVQGPSRFRTNLNTRFNLVIGNKGNVTASGVVLALVWPKDVSIQFEDKFIIPPDTGIVTLHLENDPQTYSLARKEYHFIYDSLNTIIPIDSFAGKPYSGYIRYLIIPHIPANSTIELPFIAKTSNVQSNRFITYTHKPNMWGSCHTGNYMDYNEDMTAEFIDGVDMIVDKTNIPPLKAFTKTAKIGQKHAGSAASYMGKHFWAWYDGYEVDENAAMADWMQETEANNAYAMQTATDELGGYMLNKGLGKLAKNYQTRSDFIGKRLANNPNMSPKLSSAYRDKLSKISGADKRLKGLKEMFDNTKNLATLSDKLVKLQKMVADCPELQKQLDDLIKELDNELNQQDVKETKTNSVTSMDPNEINGPLGYGTKRYINRKDCQRFQVNFENVDTATAAAQVVMVRDTLDKTKFDLGTFEFGSVSIGTKNFRVPKGRKEFVFEQQLSSTMNVRINGQLDLLTGIITWQFTAIDPLTKDIPVLEGFLPPNVTKPEGEGSVSYTVFPIASIADGTVFTNRASIVFDNNPPIATNTWQNINDIVSPTSLVSASKSADNKVIHLKFTGNDATSGIGYYYLYVRINGGPWIAFSGTSTDSIVLLADVGKTYGFCAIAMDKAGNLETKTLIEEATVITPVEVVKHDLVIRPNPAEDILYIDGLEAESAYTIMDISGRAILKGTMNPDNNQVDVSSLKKGLYIITVEGNFKQSFKLIKQ